MTNIAYFDSLCIVNNTPSWQHDRLDLRDWRLRPNFSNPTRLYSVEVRSVNGTWYTFCARNDGVESVLPFQLCQTASEMLFTDNTSLTHVAVERFGPEVISTIYELPLTSLTGNCPMYGLLQKQVYCQEGKMILPNTVN